MKKILYRLFEHQNLEREESRNLLHGIAQGNYNDAQIASLMTVFLMRNISIEELAGFRDALLELRHPVQLDAYQPIDIVGTGGDGKDTFNISTCAGFVVAGAGYHVVKHGNYGASTVSGASNLIAHFGVKFTNDNDQLHRSIEASNFAFLHAPLFNPALKAVVEVRKDLHVRSFFNMLGPLVNPANPTYQLLGVYNLPLQRLYSYQLQEQETKFAVVHSLDGYDEISLTAPFKVTTAQGEKIYTPEELGFNVSTQQALHGGNTIEAAARIFQNVLTNRSTPEQRNAVVANAAFAIRLMEPYRSLSESIAQAEESLQSGKAAACFNRFITHNA